MLEWLKDVVRPIRMQDSRFGDLRYLRDAQFWEGRTNFVPTRTNVELLISAPPTGPTERQRRLFDELQERYATLWPELHRMLESEAERAGIQARTFVLVCVDLPAAMADSGVGEWDLSYETSPPSWHFTVRMMDWTPAEVIAEC